MPDLIGLDYETYGAEDLPTHGLARYVGDKTFQPLIGSVALQGAGRIVKRTLDFVHDRRAGKRELADAIGGAMICAHNAPFEQAVLDHIGLHYPSSRFIDSAVVARAAGAGSSLGAAAPQLLGVNKLDEGRDLIKLFSIPGPYQEASGSKVFDPQVILDNVTKWQTFKFYCELDAELSLRLVDNFYGRLASREMEFQAITMDMNRTGWCVDLDLVEEMQRRYLENQAVALEDFRTSNGAVDLNLNSLPQMKKWCAERGVKATSFDEKHVESLLKRLDKKLETMLPDDSKWVPYCEVRELLETKQILGGSSLKKLRVILDTAVPDGRGGYRLLDQYMHCGAGQTLRTTGRSVQMQNLKRLTADIGDMEELFDPSVEWDNTKLAVNLRQAFTATDPNGRLIVGDFSSVESRGLAWAAGAGWKLDAFRAHKDMYKVLAQQIYNVGYDDVTKEQRQTGKVGELACGYGAGGDAVQAFAAGMGVEMEPAEAAKLVSDWRAVNPEITTFWAMLDEMLHGAIEKGVNRFTPLADGMTLRIGPCHTPATLIRQHPTAQSLEMAVLMPGGMVFLKRYFHGCYTRGRNISYYKPSDRKTGDLWSSHYVDPKTKQVRFYELYGGKLAGILTQSFCRELFFRSLAEVSRWASMHNEIGLVGQFHDEIVLDWRPVPGALGLDEAKAQFKQRMSDPGVVTSFPLAADIKDDYRYTK